MFSTDDVRIEGLRPLIPPAILLEELPLSARILSAVSSFHHLAVDQFPEQLGFLSGWFGHGAAGH